MDAQEVWLRVQKLRFHCHTNSLMAAPSSSLKKKILFRRLFFIFIILGEAFCREELNRGIGETLAQIYDGSLVFQSWWPTIAALNKPQYPALFSWFKANQDLPLWGRTLGFWLQCQTPGGLLGTLLRIFGGSGIQHV